MAKGDNLRLATWRDFSYGSGRRYPPAPPPPPPPDIPREAVPAIVFALRARVAGLRIGAWELASALTTQGIPAPGGGVWKARHVERVWEEERERWAAAFVVSHGGYERGYRRWMRQAEEKANAEDFEGMDDD